MSSDRPDKRPSLKVFSRLTPGLGDDEHLKPGYAYLIRSSVRMPELYPLLGELLFASRVVYKNHKETPPNIIGMFVEDTPDNLTTHLGMPDRFAELQNINVTEKFVQDALHDRGTAAWLDTFGEFHQASDNLYRMKVGEGPKWWRKRIAGAGNPMAVMRFFRLAQETEAHANLNLFVLNSLSNLYRNVKLSETAAFLRTLLNQSIWSAEFYPERKKLRDRTGLFFAVLQEDVLEPQEDKYLESFFDGIIKVKPNVLDEKLRVARVQVEVLPELVELAEDFVYLPKWRYEQCPSDFNKSWDLDPKYIVTHSADNCKDLGVADKQESKRPPQ